MILQKRIMKCTIMETNNFEEVANKRREEHLLWEYDRVTMKFQHVLETIQKRSYCFDEVVTVLIFLRFAGHQTAGFRDVGDRFNITISSVHRIIRRVTVFLSNLSPQIITWPEEDEKLIIQQHFLNNGFPGIIGAIDGCHIKIDRPEIDPDSYINRKGYYSIQMQVVCDNELKIRDVFVGYPGSVHDSRVFRNSPLYTHLEEKCGHYFILGDSGYPLQKKLLTPFRDRGQLNRQQINYNTKLSKDRYVIEHCFGVMKQKFRQLYHLKLRNIEMIVHFIRAMCVLHNIALKDDFAPNEDIVANDNVPHVHHDIDNDDGENYDDRDSRRDELNLVLVQDGRGQPGEVVDAPMRFNIIADTISWATVDISYI
ncbi:uncharacterized protein CBL_10105 [Carabus blaptoides fortunei]